MQKEAGSWTDGHHQVPVQEIRNNLWLHLYKDHIEFAVQACYDPEVEEVKKETDYLNYCIQFTENLVSNRALTGSTASYQDQIDQMLYDMKNTMQEAAHKVEKTIKSTLF